ncbi:holin family protein [Rhodalgimonas zhirmunskyi]|uniref:Holin family protein n=1 Tax=Rhodalgimonas zhirmunskyi TaxID=2964767 RepID=A0AAJ1U6K8_9RHOB|nr:holin family protein [Rhodoalgimonas zhirmunskyi]MDQ2092670.1 holin family protein [Rhodoalgimonas zhirmunskyi]
MGLIERMLTLVFGNGGNALRDTAEVFRENAEAAATRAAQTRASALGQFGAEFKADQRGVFDRIMDGINRLPRPALALGTLGLFIAAMVDPVWFAARMQGIALVPEPLWWLLGAIVSFYFGARHQTKSQDLQRQISRTLSDVPRVVRNLDALEGYRRAESPGAATTGRNAQATLDVTTPETNPALEAWARGADWGR